MLLVTVFKARCMKAALLVSKRLVVIAQGLLLRASTTAHPSVVSQFMSIPSQSLTFLENRGGRRGGGGRYEDRRGGGYERRDDYYGGGGYGRRDDYFGGGGQSGVP